MNVRARRRSLSALPILLAAFAVVGPGCMAPATTAVESDEYDVLGSRAHDHLTDHNWQLEIEGVTQGVFAKIDMKSGDAITLVAGKEVSVWFVGWLGNPRAEPNDFLLIGTDDDGEDLTYKLLDAVPEATDTNVEEVTLVVEKIEKG